jgi:ubiquinone biosynthesis protein
MRPAKPIRMRSAAARGAEGREVESCLARWGLLDRPRPVAGPPPPPGLPGLQADAPFGRRLKGALQELGPVFSAFGLYLSTRVDLLAAADCLELSGIPNRVPPLPAAAVREWIAAELGRPADTILAALEAEPCESRLLVQGHRARLADGQPVVLRFVRPDAGEALERDLERLPHLAAAFAESAHGGPGGPGNPGDPRSWHSGVLGEAIADFHRSLGEGADLAATAEALGLLALDAAGFGLLAAPAVRHDLCTPRLLTVVDPGGTDLDSALGEAPEPRAGGDDARQRELARLLCVAWLRQALEGRVFPVALPEAGARVLAGGRLALLAGSFARPPAADRVNLRGFLTAMAAHAPDDACSFLLREMTPEGPEAAEEALRLQCRQVVPFRDGAWSAAGTSLAEHVFVLARLARAYGFRPRAQLLAFYRGLAAAALAVRQLAPLRQDGDDVLLEALEEVRVLTSFAQVREAMTPPWSDQLGRYAMLMSELPGKLDDLLSQAAQGGARMDHPDARRPARRESGAHLLLGGALLVLAALALLLHYFVRTGALAGRGEAMGATLFLAVGGILLWILARSR